MPSRPLALAALVLLAGSAHAQSNLGELLDFGAQKLGPHEIRAIGDVRVIVRNEDADAFMALRSNGAAVGMVHNKQGAGSSELVGKWTLDADGRRCTDISLPAFGTAIRQCGYTYRLGKDVYFSRSDVDRNSNVIAYTGPAFLK
ncbi:MAG: hypothetical protein V4669_01275 [Pseudomonadota bacterium]